MMLMKMLKHPKINQLIENIPKNTQAKLIARRFGLGACIAIFVIILIQLWPTSKKDDQSIEFPNISLKVTSDQPIVTNDPKQNNDIETASIFDFNKQYPKFEKNRQKLSQIQINAIQNDLPRVSIILNNFGRQSNLLDQFLDLSKGSISIALSPYTPKFNEVTADLINNKIEPWLYIHSIETTSYKDNGPLALNPSRNLETNLELLEKQLLNKNSIVGITTSPQAVITKIESVWGKLAHDLYAQGYALFDQSGKNPTGGLLYNQNIPAPFINDAFILNSDNYTRQEFTKELNYLRNRILDDKNLILSITIDTPQRLDIFMQWVDSLLADEIEIIPLSAQAKI